MNNPLVMQTVNFVLKWLGVGIVIHFGLKFGEMIDAAATFI